jgi:hypothetical protein
MSSKIEKAKRLVQNVETLLGGESSIELSKTSKGTNWKVKVYHEDPQEAMLIASNMFDKCKAKYGEVSE